MKTMARQAITFILFTVFAYSAAADVSCSWAFAVTLGDLGSGNADITLVQEADGKLSGTYSGQLANGPIAGTYADTTFEFAFNSGALGADITYRGELAADGTVKGAVVVQGQDIGSFTGRKKE